MNHAINVEVAAMFKDINVGYLHWYIENYCDVNQVEWCDLTINELDKRIQCLTRDEILDALIALLDSEYAITQYGLGDSKLRYKVV